MNTNASTAKLDFEGLNSFLLVRATSLLTSWLPGGIVKGSSFLCGDIYGSKGESLKVNLQTGQWKDYASDHYFGADLISLYAGTKGISNGDAYKILADDHGYRGNTMRPPAVSKGPELDAPPLGTTPPNMNHYKLGEPIETYEYKGKNGETLFYVAKYVLADGKKSFCPYSWSKTSSSWVMKAWPKPRPLYGLDLVCSNKDKPLLIVEGEKACHAARAIEGSPYIVITWPSGAAAWQLADWSVVKGRKILLWPDADEAGLKAMLGIAGMLVLNNDEVKIIDVSNRSDGWDAADANFKTFKDMVTWAKPLAAIIDKPMRPEVLEPESKDVRVTVDTGDSVQENVNSAWDRLGLSMTKTQGPIINLDNVVRILYGQPEIRDSIWFDEFHNRVFTTWGQGGKLREWTDIDDIGLAVYLQRELGIRKMTEKATKSAVDLYAFQRTRNEPRDWMETLVWDGKNRNESFFTEAFGADDNDYIRAASRNWWLAMVARVYSPGCKFDNMVVLEGKQGKFKSTALDIIGGKWFMEATVNIGTIDFLQSLNGKLIVEIAELDGFSKSDVNTVKKTISCRVDTYRASFARRSKDYKRQCVFVGTTNEDEYLEDSTGGRRFWPVKTGKIDLAMIKDQREQLFAEAVARFKQGQVWWEMPESARFEQETRRRSDAWEGPVLRYLSGREEVELLDVALSCLEFDPSRFDKRSQMRLGHVLRSLGWCRKVKRIGSLTQRVWVRDEGGGNTNFDNGSQNVSPLSLVDQKRVIKNWAPGAE